MSLQHARQRLLTTREELEARLVRTRKHMHRAEAPSPNFHEQVVETANDAVVQALDADAQRDIERIDRALRRIDSGTYPYCVDCGKEIGEERHAALPWTDRCMRCA
ncbi:MAG: TraR/DksA C4-type zinc finger protein [Pseudomonadota bacterium]|nr:TraR/DksA C4-type zinc finger protein [Pseudomonadota bacterium]